MESIIVDQTRRRVGDSSGGGGGASAMRPRNKSVNSLSLSQLLLPNHQYFAPTSHYDLQQQQMSYWSSLPSPFSISDQIKLASPSQPPLLPLPPKATRSREKQTKPVSQRKGSGGRQCGREPKDQVQLQKKELQEATETLTEEEEEESSIYSLSPPPSNLPLPSFVLTRQAYKGVALEATAAGVDA